GYASFIRHVLPTAVRRGYAVLAMKTLANGRLTDKGEIGRREPIIPARLTIAEALGFAWSLPIASLVLGVDTAEQLHENCAVARQAPALTEADRLALIQRVAAFAGREREYYKS
ncbi:MAG: aldo/keto reductase, partial [Planctomycetota bacterium]